MANTQHASLAVQSRPSKRQALASAMALGVIGALIIWMVPAFMILLARLAPLDERQVGYATSWDLNVMALAIGASAFLLHRVNWRWLAYVSLAFIVVGNVATNGAHSYLTIVISRIIAGLGEGLAIGVSFAALGRAENPDRAFSIYLVAGALFSSGLLWALPTLEHRFGAAVLFLGFAAMAIPVGVSLRWLPDGQISGPIGRAGVQIDRRLAIAGLAAVFFYFLAQGAMWGYLAQIAQAHHLAPDQISRALAVAVFAGIGGAALAGVLPRGLGRAVPLLVSGIVSIVSYHMLLGELSGLKLLVAAVLLTFAWNVSQPLLSGLCSDADPKGRIVAAMGSIQTFGFGFGPAAAAMLLRNGHFGPIVLGSSGAVAFALCLAMAGMRRPFGPPAVNDADVLHRMV